MPFQSKLRNPNCTLCPLYREAQHVCLMGSGSKKSKIAIVGEAPGAREDEEHKSFVGPAGQLLDEMLDRIRLSRESVYITNTCKCRPPGNRSPEKKEIKTCTEAFLRLELEKISPDYVLALGNSALYALTKKTGITRHRGDLMVASGTSVFPVYHPAYILRQPQFRKDLEADFTRFGRMIRGEEKNDKTSVRVVKTLTQLRAVVRHLEISKEISYDIETNSLYEWREDSAIVSISFSTQEGSAIVVPLWHKESPFSKGEIFRWQDILGVLKPCLERTDAKYIAHNGKFDCRWLARFGVFVPQTFDTMLAAHMLDENRSKSLKQLAQTLLGVAPWAEQVRDLYNMPLGKLARYNGKDTDYTLRLYHVFREQLKDPEERRTARVFIKLMMPASNALTHIEGRGLWLDQERWQERYKQAELKKLKYRTKMMETTQNKGLNFNSPQQVGKWLFGELGLPLLATTPKGAPSTAESVLLQLAKMHPAAKTLMEYRKIEKYISTYFRPYGEKHDSRNRIHTTYKLFGTVTGRLSSEGPNLQQVPRDRFIRSLLGAPSGWSFVEADYSQIELRIIAWLANERSMLRAFHTGTDLHLKTASETTGKNIDEIEAEERKKAKAVNFGFVYGMGAPKFVTYARDNYDVEVAPSEAEAVRERFFRAYPALRPWHDRQRRLARRYGVVYSPFGRARHLPSVWSEDQNLRADAERQAINSPVQSCGSDLMLLSLVRLEASLPRNVAFLVGTVHDALLFQVRTAHLEEILPTIRETMEDTETVRKKFGVELTVPIKVDIKYGSHWGEGEEWTP